VISENSFVFLGFFRRNRKKLAFFKFIPKKGLKSRVFSEKNKNPALYSEIFGKRAGFCLVFQKL